MKALLMDLSAQIRSYIEPGFCERTAVPNSWNPLVPSSGHCAVVAMFVRNVLGGQYVSASPMGISHWFNRVQTPDGRYFDVDLTGDQFGRSKVHIGEPGSLFEETRIRLDGHLNQETIDRYEIFLARLG